jgi:RNA 2',3'-cyclic 3'-phosphodiesterase
MRMSAALIPPPPVLEDLAAVVRSVRGHDTQLEPVPADLMRLPLGNFGNVGLADRMALQEALTEEVSRWAPLQLRFRGGCALVDPGDDSVWAEMSGDLEQLTAMGSVVPRVVHRLGFLIDRRSFRTRMRVGRITAATSIEFLERLLSRLDGYAGPAWTSHHVSLLRDLSGDRSSEPMFEVMQELRLVGDAEGTGVTGTPGGRHRDQPQPAGDPVDGAGEPTVEPADRPQT